MNEIHYKFCPKCQTKTRLTAQFCEICGRKFRTQFSPNAAPAEQTGVFTSSIDDPFFANRPSPAANRPKPSPDAPASKPTAPNAPPLGNRATVGFRYIVAGALIAAYFIFFFDISISPQLRLPDVDRIQKQILGVLAGVSIAIVGTILTSVGYAKGETINWRAAIFGNGQPTNTFYVMVGSIIVVLLSIIWMLMHQRSPQPPDGNALQEIYRVAPRPVMPTPAFQYAPTPTPAFRYTPTPPIFPVRPR